MEFVYFTYKMLFETYENFPQYLAKKLREPGVSL